MQKLIKFIYLAGIVIAAFIPIKVNATPIIIEVEDGNGVHSDPHYIIPANDISGGDQE